MKSIVVLIGMAVLLMAGFWLLYTGLRELITSPSGLEADLLTFLSGLVCLIAGLITGVYALKPEAHS